MCCWVCYVVIFFSVTNTRQWFIVVVTEHESDTFQLAFDLKKTNKKFYKFTRVSSAYLFCI